MSVQCFAFKKKIYETGSISMCKTTICVHIIYMGHHKINKIFAKMYNNSTKNVQCCTLLGVRFFSEIFFSIISLTHTNYTALSTCDVCLRKYNCRRFKMLGPPKITINIFYLEITISIEQLSTKICTKPFQNQSNLAKFAPILPLNISTSIRVIQF